MSGLDVLAGLCLVGILAVVLAAPFVKQYRGAQVRLRYSGGDQARPVTFNDQMARMHMKLVAFGRAFGAIPEERVYSRAESAYLNLWAAWYAARELSIMAAEKVRSADPLWVALAVAAGLVGAATGLLLETLVWSINQNT